MEQQFSSSYTDQGMAKALDTFNCWQEHKNHPRLRVLGLRYLFKHRDKKHTNYRCPKTDQLVQKASEMFTEFLNSKEIEFAREVADVVITYVPNSRKFFLDRLRERDNIIVEPINRIVEQQVKIKTVYTDSQNVHNTKINNSVIHAAKMLCQKYEHIINIRNGDEGYKNHLLFEIEHILKHNHPNESRLIEKKVEYIRTNTATFGTAGTTMKDVFISVWFWIVEHKQQKELEKRLLEELKDMDGGICSTGHLSRLVNVIQGFTTDEELCIRISDTEQCKAVISQYLTTILGECKDEQILDGILDGNEQFIKFIRLRVSEKLLEWQNTYGKSMLSSMAKIVNGYCGTVVFKL